MEECAGCRDERRFPGDLFMRPSHTCGRSRPGWARGHAGIPGSDGFDFHVDERLPEDAQRILNDNLWDLYE